MSFQEVAAKYKLNSPRWNFHLGKSEAHLQYGQLSTALINYVLYDTRQHLWFDAAYEIVHALTPLYFIGLSDEDQELFRFHMLFIAEYLADEGL